MLSHYNLIQAIHNSEPIKLVKFNDGELNAIIGKRGSNCDNHAYDKSLQKELQLAYSYLYDRAYFSEYSLVHRYSTVWGRVLSKLPKPEKVFNDNLLLHNIEGFRNNLLPYIYRAIRVSTQPKILVAPKRINAEDFLKTQHRVNVPLVNAFKDIGSIIKQCVDHATTIDKPLFLLCCGFASCILTKEITEANPNATIIDIGSGLDPLFPGCTRKDQISQLTARGLYLEIKQWPDKVHYYKEIEGWFNYQDLYTLVVESASDNELSHFVEVGCWKGKSTSYLATEIANSNKNIILDVVDHFKGSVGERDTNHKAVKTQFVRGHAANNLRPYWLTGTNKGYENRVDNILKIVPQNSVMASFDYAPKSLDFVFIDAGHTYREVRNDIIAWISKIKPQGIIAGHDYNSPSFPGVTKAVNECLPSAKAISKNCWFYRVP